MNKKPFLLLILCPVVHHLGHVVSEIKKKQTERLAYWLEKEEEKEKKKKRKKIRKKFSSVAGIEPAIFSLGG